MPNLIKYTEIFYSVQGEGYYTGVPTIFIRLFGCNFTCNGFSQPSDLAQVQLSTIGDLPIKDITELTAHDFAVGCDSRYSWHKDYVHLSKQDTAEGIANAIIAATPKNKFSINNMPIHLCFTGGEPTMHQQAILDILRAIDRKMEERTNGYLIGNDSGFPLKVTIETNASLSLKKHFISGLNDWKDTHALDREILWSNSPKLSHSGESYERSLKPSVIQSQTEVSRVISFKFVVRPVREDFEELNYFVNEYLQEVKCLKKTNSTVRIYAMPVGSTKQQQHMIQSKVALMCMDYGISYSPRIHCDLFNNALMS